MTDTIELTDIFLRLIGAFYAFAGFVATRAAMTSRLIDIALAALSAKKPSRIETAQSVWLIAAAALVLAGGVLLLAGLDLAATLFVASAIGQAVYIYVLAPRYFDRGDPPDPVGRRQTTNAFVVFSAATAFVVWGAWRGRLTALDEATKEELVAVAAALLIYAGYVAYALWSTSDSRSPLASNFAGDPHIPARPLSTSKRVKLRAEYGCDPLWALDEDLFGCFPPRDLELSADLTRAIEAWAARYEGSYVLDDPAAHTWTAEDQAAHEVEGRRLASRLKEERPDLRVFVEGAEGEVEEVRASGGSAATN